MTGKGRGRGWLKLDKTQDIEPGQSSIQSPPIINHQNYAPTTPHYSMPNMTQCDKAINAISQFNENDDGILINQKFKYIIELLNGHCKNQQDVKDAFNYIYTKAIKEGAFLEKFLIFISLNSFRTQNICEESLRKLLIDKFQKDFENAQTMQATNKTTFHNSIRIMGGFYERATMANNNTTYYVLTTPLISYFELLLDAGQSDDIELFATQLHINGARILISGQNTSVYNNLLIKIRNVLISNKNLSEISKVWLLLAMDLANNEFRMLPSDLLNYYQTKLGEKDVINLQKSLNVLSIQTLEPSKTLENYTSDVNVLQVDTAIPANNTKPVINHQNHYQNEMQKSPQFKTEKSTDEMYTNWESPKEGNNKRPPSNKPGRPILGAGARNFNKNNSWRDQCKENSAGWDAKQKNTDGSGWGGGNKTFKEGAREPRSNKGWEHDDRFETDYN